MCKSFEKSNCAEKWELLIIGLCVLLLLFGLTTFVVKQWWLIPEPQRIEVVVVPQDSVRADFVYDKASLDSLISNVNSQIDENERKYVQLSNVQEDERIKSVASMLIGIISAIALFFGYKSFRDIREKGKEMSIEVAEKAAKKIAEESSKEYLASQLPEIVKTELNNGLYKEEVIKSITASIVSQVKPELLSEIDRAIENLKNEDKGQQENIEEAMSPEEMFNEQKPTLEESSATQNDSSSEEPDVKTSSEESDGKD